MATKSETKSETRSDEGDVDLLGLDEDELRRMLRLMMLGRRFEEKAAEAYQTGKIGGFCHLYMGQEAVAAGCITPLRDDDYVITAYRDHVQAIVRGMDPKAVMAELYGRVDGCSGGMGGSMHMFDRSLNFMGGHAIVGTHVPIAAGVGYAIRYREEDAGLPVPVRRLGRQRRAVPRGVQHGGQVRASGRIRVREQLLRDGHRHSTAWPRWRNWRTGPARTRTWPPPR